MRERPPKTCRLLGANFGIFRILEFLNSSIRLYCSNHLFCDRLLVDLTSVSNTRSRQREILYDVF